MEERSGPDLGKTQAVLRPARKWQLSCEQLMRCGRVGPGRMVSPPMPTESSPEEHEEQSGQTGPGMSARAWLE